MKTFYEWLQEAADFQALWNYFQTIAKNPNAEDLKTLLDMMARQYPDRLHGMLSDMMPTIEKDIIPKLNPSEQEEIKNYFGRLQHKDPRFKTGLIQKGWHPLTSKPFKFEAPHVFQDTLENEMEEEYPDLSYITNLIKNNQEFFQNLGQDYIKEFQGWYKSQIDKQKAQQLDWSKLFSTMFKGEEPSQ